MKFAAGFQFIDGPVLFSEMVCDYREHVGEVYFAPPGFASGRPDPGNDPSNWEQLEYELGVLRKNGIALDLLLNANCYGEWAVSERFANEIFRLLDYLEHRGLLPEVVTAASPFAAHAVKRYSPEIEVRASVNMRLDSTTAMAYLGEDFDSFYIRRDLQRNLENVKKFSSWCRSNGKKLCMLANSGCLRNCPYQTFHDNMVAHDSRIREIRNVKDFLPHLCWKRFKKKENWSDFLRASWIRPEDIMQYAGYVDVVKLATRQHAVPRMIIAAYTSGSFDGNAFDLTEPCFAEYFAPYILDNKALNSEDLPKDCAINCTACGRCEKVLSKALIRPLE